MSEINIDDFLEALKKNPYVVHNCSMCSYPCAFSVRDNQLGYDSGCDCVSSPTMWSPRDIESLYFYLQPEHGHIECIKKFIEDNTVSTDWKWLEDIVECLDEWADEKNLANTFGRDSVDTIYYKKQLTLIYCIQTLRDALEVVALPNMPKLHIAEYFAHRRLKAREALEKCAKGEFDG